MTSAEAAETGSAEGPIAAYRGLRRQGVLVADEAQQAAAERLQSLYRALLDYRPGSGLHNWLTRFGLAGHNGAPVPHGLYLFGPVGRGKTMLMDLFFAAVSGPAKRRVHFNAFMLEVHDRIERERRARTRTPIAKVASDLAQEAALLCFDELQVEDIADAMILERLFRALFEAGVVMVATSNRAPDKLYEHGLNRERFLPFVALLEQKLDVLQLDSGRDYRLARLAGRQVYHRPADAQAHAALEAAFAELTDGAGGDSLTLTVKGRRLVVPRAARGVAWFGFADLCAQPLGAADYLAVAARFAVVIVEGIPRLGRERRDEARRFNILIDTLYDAGTLLIASADAPPEELYPEGDGSFAFRRTVSRLNEMQSAEWVAARQLR